MKVVVKIGVVLSLYLGIFTSCVDKKIQETEVRFEETAFRPCCGEPSGVEKPLSIHLAVNDTYCKKTACACIHDIASRDYQELQTQLKKGFNIDLQLTYYIESYEMEDQIKVKTHDGLICKPWTAFMLSQEHKIEYKRIVDVLDVYDNQWLNGVFLVNKNSSLKSISDIGGKTLVAGQEDAYEKYHSPLNLLDSIGVKPGIVYHKASCLECLNELMDHKAEVALVSDYVMSASCAVDVASEDDFRIIGETEKMPLCSVILDMNKISKADAMRFQNALLALSKEKSPEGMLSKGFVKPASWIPNRYSKPLAKN